MAEIEVVAPGLLTSVQDARGRPGFERFGVPSGGAMDWLSASAANALVGNQVGAATLEITAAGPALRFGRQAAFALAGADLSATIDGEAVPVGVSWLARPGAVLSFGERRTGLRAYLAVAGGIQVPLVLGSPSTDLRGGFGGADGRTLVVGDRLAIADLPNAATRVGRWLPPPQRWNGPVRVLRGPHLHRFPSGAFDELCGREWTIGEQADRMGYRLVGPPLAHLAGADVASLGLPTGAVQVPGDGHPIVLLVDHQPTGGYTVIAHVISADLPILAQRGSGDSVQFEETTLDKARAALRDSYQALAAVRGDDATWEAVARAE